MTNMDSSGYISPLKVWFMAIRPRTLPLAISGIVLGGALASLQVSPDILVFWLALLTALFLQILSNLANDYGDAVSGADTEERVGPTRVVSTGLSTKEGMKRAIILAAGLSLGCGMLTSVLGSIGKPLQLFFFLCLGVVCVIAAIAYTMGRRPYGYMGLGDLMVFIFFGWLQFVVLRFYAERI